MAPVTMAAVETAAGLPMSTDLISIEEYLRMMYHPDREYVDGRVEERNSGEYEHGMLQMELGYWFRSHRDEWRIHVVAEWRTRVSGSRIRIPDVCVISFDSAREPVRITPALLCIEILSPEDRLVRTVKVREEYLAMGVEHLWIIDPYERVAYTYTHAGLLKVIGHRLAVDGTPIYLELPTLFAALD